MKKEIHQALLAMGFVQGSEMPLHCVASYHHHTPAVTIDLPLGAGWPEVAHALIGAGAEIQKRETKELISTALRRLGFRL